MLILKILLFILGTVFSTFGYLIYFRKKYSLVNSFNLDVVYKRKDSSYAKKLGLIEFVLGLGLIVLAIILTIIS